MLDLDQTTPIINLIQKDRDLLRSYQNWMRCPLPNLSNPGLDAPSVRRSGESTVQYAKRLLGKQTYCKTFLCKCWIWVGPSWVLFASNRGLELQVARDVDPGEALRDFCTRWYAQDIAWVLQEVPPGTQIRLDLSWWYVDAPHKEDAFEHAPSLVAAFL